MIWWCFNFQEYTIWILLMLLENQWTAVSWAEGWKTCKREKDDRIGHRFGAGLGGSDAFVCQSLPEKAFDHNSVFKCTIHTWVQRENDVLCLLVIQMAFQTPLDLRTRGGSVALHLAGCYQFGAWCWATPRGLNSQNLRRTLVHDEGSVWWGVSLDSRKG